MKYEYINMPDDMQKRDLLIGILDRFADERNIRQQFVVPVELADMFSNILKRYLKPEYKMHRRARGPRRNRYAGHTLVADATHFGYYINNTRY